MFLHRVGGVMSVVRGRGWSARFGGLAWCGVFVFAGSSLIVANGLQEEVEDQLLSQARGCCPISSYEALSLLDPK